MSKEHTTEHLRAELKSLSDTLEEVLSSSGEKSKEELSKIRSKAEQALKQSKQNLPGQAEFYIFHQNNFLNGAPFPVQKRENVTYCQGMNCVALVCRFF